MYLVEEERRWILEENCSLWIEDRVIGAIIGRVQGQGNHHQDYVWEDTLVTQYTGQTGNSLDHNNARHINLTVRGYKNCCSNSVKTQPPQNIWPQLRRGKSKICRNNRMRP